MRLLASLMSQSRFHEVLAIIDVESDTPEKVAEDEIRRTITGNVRQFGPIWEPFFHFWEMRDPVQQDGESYQLVNSLQVDHDSYSTDALIWSGGQRIKLVLVETFNGSVEEYKQELQQRNKRVQEYLDKWDRGEITGNDIRELRGREPLPQPHANQLLTPEALAEQRKVSLGRDNKQTWNSIH